MVQNFFRQQYDCMSRDTRELARFVATESIANDKIIITVQVDEGSTSQNGNAMGFSAQEINCRPYETVYVKPPWSLNKPSIRPAISWGKHGIMVKKGLINGLISWGGGIGLHDPFPGNSAIVTFLGGLSMLSDPVQAFWWPLPRE